MKLSEITLTETSNHWEAVRVETTTDAHQLIYDEADRAAYINEYGDVDMTYDAEYKVWRAPAFANQIRQFTEAKAEDCARWGCE